MIRSIALSAVMAATLAGAAPAFAQGAVGGGATCSSDSLSCNPVPRGSPGASHEVPGAPGYPRPPQNPSPPRPPRRPPHPPYYPGPPPGYYRPAPPPYYYYEERISCREARAIVRSEGFRNVKAIDCEGRQYQFRATYRGRPVIVVISSRSGRILDVRYR